MTNIPDILTRRGGIVARGIYGGIDLSRYDGHLGQQWGDRNGPPRSIISESQEHQAREAALVSSVQEARDALWSGYPLIIGAEASFSENRDSFGFAKLTGSDWAHSQCVAAVSSAYMLAGNEWRRYGRRPESPCYLVINSWGAWNDGPKGRFEDIPDGSYWITAKAMQFVIDQQQVIAVGNFDGFHRPPIETYGFNYLENDSPPRTSIATKHFGLVEVARAIMSVASDLKDITIPESEIDEFTPDPHRPRPPPEPDTNWMPFNAAIELAKETDEYGPFLVLFGSQNCSWCEKQKQEIDRIAEEMNLITTYLDHSKYREVMKQSGSIERVPTICVWDTSTKKKYVHHVGFVDSNLLEKMIVRRSN